MLVLHLKTSEEVGSSVGALPVCGVGCSGGIRLPASPRGRMCGGTEVRYLWFNASAQPCLCTGDCHPAPAHPLRDSVLQHAHVSCTGDITKPCVFPTADLILKSLSRILHFLICQEFYQEFFFFSSHKSILINFFNFKFQLICERSPAGLLRDGGLQHPHLLRALLLLVVRAAGLAPRVVLVRVAVVDVELVQHLGHAAQPAAQKFAGVQVPGVRSKLRSC